MNTDLRHSNFNTRASAILCGKEIILYKMFKITAIVSLMLIATWSQADSKRHKKEATASSDFPSGSTLWAASLSCDSCGSECASACGTRHFRSCCFNYLRKKRGPEAIKFLNPNQDLEGRSKSKLPMFVVENIPVPEQWVSTLLANENHPYSLEDMIENRLYDA